MLLSSVTGYCWMQWRGFDWCLSCKRFREANPQIFFSNFRVRQGDFGLLLSNISARDEKIANLFCSVPTHGVSMPAQPHIFKLLSELIGQTHEINLRSKSQGIIPLRKHLMNTPCVQQRGGGRRGGSRGGESWTSTITRLYGSTQEITYHCSFNTYF